MAEEQKKKTLKDEVRQAEQIVKKDIKHAEDFLSHLLHKHRKLKIHLSVTIIILIVAIGVFGYLNLTLWLDNSNKASTIQTQNGLIETQGSDIKYLNNVVANQTKRLDNLTVAVDDQKKTIGAQNTELEKKGLYITLLLNNVTSLTSTITTKEAVINNLRTQLGQTESQVNSLTTQLTSTKSELSSSQQRVQSLTPITKGYFVAAVTTNGSGVMVPMEVKFVGGTGKQSIDLHNVDVSSTTQDSIRTAAIVAQQVTSVGLGSSDITVSFTFGGTSIISIDGPSAGAAITTTMIAAIQNKNINNNVLMTGTINVDGSIGQIGGQQAKAEGAKAQGATKFLVPVGQLVNVTGLEVVEVANINQAVALIVS